MYIWKCFIILSYYTKLSSPSFKKYIMKICLFQKKIWFDVIGCSWFRQKKVDAEIWTKFWMGKSVILIVHHHSGPITRYIFIKCVILVRVSLRVVWFFSQNIFYIECLHTYICYYTYICSTPTICSVSRDCFLSLLSRDL